MRIQRLGLIFALLLTFVVASSAQEDCSEFSNAADYALRAERSYDQRLYDDAVLDYTCAIQISPDASIYYLGRGNAYYWLQRDAEARQDYLLVLELTPHSSAAYNNLANQYASIGDYEQALVYYEKSLSYPSGKRAIAHTNRAIIFMDTGRYDEAQADLDSARNIDSNYENLYLVQAGLYSIRNKIADAADNYRTWLQKTQTALHQPQYVLNRSYTTSMQTGDVISITFTLNAGDRFSASVAATDNLQHVDPLIVLVAPDSAAVISDDDSGVNIDAVISDYVVHQTGSYTLLVGNAGGYYHEGVDGRIQINLQRKSADGTVTIEPTPTVMATVAAPTTVATTSAPTPVATAETPVQPDATATEEPVESEELTASFAIFRLFVGTTAEVYTTVGDRLNLRSGPGLRFEILSKLDRGSFVTLLEGPRKQDGLAWWKVRTTDGAEGWAVERVDTEQTLQMALTVGEGAIITSDDGKLNIRTGAGRSNSVLVQLSDGERVTLLEGGPKIVDGFRWWRIQLADGREGWTIDRLEGERTLIPAKERDGEG